MLYILKGLVTEVSVGGKLTTKPVQYVVPLKHLRISGEYLSYGGIPIEASSLIRVEDELAGDAAYVDFVTRVSDSTRAIAACVIANNKSADIIERFQREADVLMKEFRMTVATKGTVDVDNLRGRLYETVRAYQ
jgi:hypothetical protein